MSPLRKLGPVAVLLMVWAGPASADCPTVGVSSLPLAVSRCTDLERETGMVHVGCPIDPGTFDYVVGGAHADPDDQLDDTAAIQAAIRRARAQQLGVFLPAGCTTNQGYLITSQLDVTDVRLLGEAHSDLLGNTTLMWDGPGPAVPPPPLPLPPPDIDLALSAMLFANGATRLESTTLDGRGDVPIGLYVQTGAPGPESMLRNLAVRRMSRAGMVLEQAHGLLLDRVVTHDNLDGLVVVDSSHVSMERVRAVHNRRHGIVVTARGPEHDASIIADMAVIKDNRAHGIYVVSGSNAYARASIINSSIRDNQGCGVVVDRGSHVEVSYSLITGSQTGDNTAVRLRDCDACAVVNNRIGSSDAVADFEDIVVLGSAKQPAWFGNHYIGPRQDGRVVEILYDADPAGPNPVVLGRQNGVVTWWSKTTPSVGWWRVGDIVWHMDPTPGEPWGWMCGSISADGRCTEWLGMGQAPWP